VTARDPIPEKFNQLSGNVIQAAFAVHSQLGPGLLERVYQTCLAHELRKRGLSFEQEVSLPILYDGLRLEAGLRTEISGTLASDSPGPDVDLLETDPKSLGITDQL